jgi:nuclear cap-binding protein subunit 1
MSPQIESLAALIGYYSQKFNPPFLHELVGELIPGELRRAFAADQFRIVKLLLRLLSAFVTYGMVTSESFGRLLRDLGGLIEESSPCRGEALCRALLVVLHLSAESVPSLAYDEVVQRVTSFVQTRPAKFIQRVSPFADQEKSLLQLLQGSLPLPVALTADYVSLFAPGEGESEAEKPKPIDIPVVQFSFGEVDRAPFPLVLVRSEESATGFGPLLADIADDILVFFASDIGLAADQLAALPLLIGHPSFKSKGPKGKQSGFVATIVGAAVISDVLRIPDSYYPPAFHVALFGSLMLMQEAAEHFRAFIPPVILDVVESAGTLDPGSYGVFVKFFSHHLSNWSFSWCWEEWVKYASYPPDDTRRRLVTDVIRQCFFLGNPATVSFKVGAPLVPILPPIPVVYDKYTKETEYGFMAQRLRDALAEGTATVIDDAVQTLTERLAAVEVVEIILYSLFKEEADRTIVEIDRFSTLFKTHVLEGEQWRRQLLITTAAAFYRDLPPVFEEVMTYFVLNRYCSYPEFLDYFFHPKGKTAALPESWKLFAAVISAVIKLYLTEGQIPEAQTLVKEVYRQAAKFYADVEMDAIGDRFFIGNLIDFGRRYYDVFATIGAEMNGLILAEDVKPGMKQIIETVSAFTPQ